MINEPIIPKTELLETIRRFLADKNRGISLALFAELAGLNKDYIHDVFVERRNPLTENVQRRVSLAYNRYKRGEIAVMRNIDGTRYLEYRKVPKPSMRKVRRIEFTPDGLKIKIGIQNRNDYSHRNLNEQMRGK
jgi:hypothetical protein